MIYKIVMVELLGEHYKHFYRKIMYEVVICTHTDEIKNIHTKIRNKEKLVVMEVSNARH